ncbi:MAG: 30S ribosomal protein S4 [Candidatus Pacebacteria bacterium]|nr:30S ribosomal protein S4 [Candidatus Paceibacterota bacterium]
MIKNSKCKICRRLGVKLFLKGERCLTQKCPMVKRSYPPGQKKKRRTRALSEYGEELREKQKLKKWYNLEERQFRKYVKKILESHQSLGKKDVLISLIKTLESRLDNVVFRLGIAASRPQARQLISHGHFLVNAKPVDIPGYLVKKGDKIRISPSSRKKNIFQNLPTLLKKRELPSWISLDVEKLEGKVIGIPSLEEAVPPAEVSLIFGYYSR